MSTSPSLLKTPKKRRAYRYDENTMSKKRRRSSLAGTLNVVHNDLRCRSLSGNHASVHETFDRFVPEPQDHALPVFSSPNSRRFADALGVIDNQQLNTQPAGGSSSTQTRPLHSFRKNLTKHLYELPRPPSLTSAATNLRTDPELTLSASGLADDFYSRPASWSPSGVLAVATAYSINYRNMNTAQVGYICKFNPDEDPACIEWSPDSMTLAFGKYCGEVRLFDAMAGMQTGKLDGLGYVGGMSWNGTHVLSVGTGDGKITHHDVRMKRPAKIVPACRVRVSGLKWSSNGNFMVSGGGDGTVSLWDAKAGRGVELVESEGETFERKWRQRKHTSTVKAMSWCPWRPDVFATGGGTRDGTIRVWSTSSSAQLHSVSTKSQISSLHFAPHCMEIVSTHGYSFNPQMNSSLPRTHSILVHSYPKFFHTGSIFDVGHGRISDTCLSPDGTKLVTCGGDETVRMYKIFGSQMKLEREDDKMQNQNIIR